jgi:alpha-ketoglutarate-dependent taurine dioxygenase
MLNLDSVQEGSIPQQRVYKDVVFPLVLVPSEEHKDQPLEFWRQWTERNLDELAELRRKHGAILFRDFPVINAQDFDHFVQSFHFPDYEYIGGAAPRTVVTERVFTTNDSPPDQVIPFHHEVAQSPNFPKKLFFFCEVPALEGGETPICLSNEVYTNMLEKRPEFVEKFRSEGVRYIRILPDGDDPTSAIGRGWQSTFKTNSKEQAEKIFNDLGGRFEWLPDGCVRTITADLDAIKHDPRDGEALWHNSAVAAFFGSNDSRNTGSDPVVFGKSLERLPEEDMTICQDVMESIAVVFPWHAADVLLIDNYKVLHARKTFKGPRRALAALFN